MWTHRQASDCNSHKLPYVFPSLPHTGFHSYVQYLLQAVFGVPVILASGPQVPERATETETPSLEAEYSCLNIFFIYLFRGQCYRDMYFHYYVKMKYVVKMYKKTFGFYIFSRYTGFIE